MSRPQLLQLVPVPSWRESVRGHRHRAAAGQQPPPMEQPALIGLVHSRPDRGPPLSGIYRETMAPVGPLLQGAQLRAPPFTFHQKAAKQWANGRVRPGLPALGGNTTGMSLSLASGWKFPQWQVAK